MKKLSLPALQAISGDATSGSISQRGLTSPTMAQIGTPNSHVTVASGGSFTLDAALGSGSQSLRLRASEAAGYAIEGPVVIVGDGSYTNSMPLGLNLGFVRTYQGRPFANVLHGAFGWSQTTGSGAWSWDAGKVTASVSTDRFRAYLFDGNGASGWYSGSYTVRNPDGCKIAIGNFDNSLSYQTWTTSTSFTVNISPGGANGVYLFVEGSLTNVNGNLEIIAPGCVTSYDSGNRWHPDFLAYLTALKPSTIRFMDWNTASNTIETEWADRPSTTGIFPTRTIQQEGAAMVPYEWMFDLCSRIGANPWICIPVRATNSWISNFAALANTSLPAGKQLYLEWSNETWNGRPPWLNAAQWATYLNHTKKVGTHVGSSVFSVPGHGWVTGDIIKGFWSTDNANALVTIGNGADYPSGTKNNGLLYSGYWNCYVQKIDNDTFTLKQEDNATALQVSTDFLNCIFFKPSEAGKSTNGDTNYGQRCIEIWDIIDPIVGSSRIKHLCATQAAGPGKTTTRMAYPGMSSRVDAVAVAPYFNGNFWMGRVATASGTLTPAMWSNLSNSKMYVGVYATGSTPTINDVINGTGTGYVGKCASSSYTTGSSWSSGGGGLTAISVVNGTTYDVHFVWEDTSGDRFRNSLTITASASVTYGYLADTPRNYRMRTEVNIKYTRSSTYPQHYANSGGKPIICYETALGHSASAAPAELETIMATFLEDAEAGQCIKNSLGIIASSGLGEACYFSDHGAGTSFALANNYADTTDQKYTAYTSLNGFVTKGSGYLTVPDQVAVGGQSVPGGYPYDLLTFADPSLTYYIYAGNDNGCYDISGGKLRLINGNGTPWTDPYARYVKVYATNGHDSYIFRVNANTGNWWVPNAVVHVDYENDRARINGVTYASIAAAVSAGALVVDGTHIYGPLTSSLGSSYTTAFKGTFPSAYLDSTTFSRFGWVDDGNDGNDVDEKATMGLGQLMRIFANITTGSTLTYNFSDTLDYSPGATVRAALRVEANNAAHYVNGVQKNVSVSNGIPAGINTFHIADLPAKNRAWTGTILQYVLVDAALSNAQVAALLA